MLNDDDVTKLFCLNTEIADPLMAATLPPQALTFPQLKLASVCCASTFMIQE